MPCIVAQHAHIYAGALSQTPGTPLFFQNADTWGTNSYGGYTQSPACIYFEDNYPALYPGVYQTATTFSALPATIFTGGPSPYAAALGTYVELKFVSLQGPPGGQGSERRSTGAHRLYLPLGLAKITRPTKLGHYPGKD